MVVFLDLDGTITDSAQGITRCVRYALQKLGIRAEDDVSLRRYIGPPLAAAFREFHGLDEPTSLQAVAYYRERYRDTGIWECRVYDGIPQMLKVLRKAGWQVGLVSSKPLPFAERILAHFGILEDFDELIAGNLAGKNLEKAGLVAQALKRFAVPPAGAIMVGDRRYDIEGAHHNGVKAVGVTYGFAEDGELTAAGADALANNVQELTDILLTWKEGKS